MGCYPLKEMISRALGKHNGKEKRRASHAHTMMYSQQPPVYSHQRTTVVKSVNFNNHNPLIIIPPEPDPCPPVSNHYAEPAINPAPPDPTPSQEQEVTRPKRSKKGSKKGSKKTRFALDKDGNNQPGPVHHEPAPDHPSPVWHETDPEYHGAVHREPGPSTYPGSVHREPDPARRGPVPYYTPSPLPRWEYGGRRQEYFSGEYCYYPTPIREGIYSIATDPHRLTTIFSEENPNACIIV